MFVVAPPFFDGSREFHQPATFERSDLRRDNNDKSIKVQLLRTSRLVRRVTAFIAAVGHTRTAPRSRRTDRGIGHHSRAGVHSSATPALDRSTRWFRHRARLDRRALALIAIGAGCSVIAAPLWGLFDTSGHARASDCVQAHSSGRITPGCTRRRRARFFISPW